jgi:DNA modification methylase
MITIASYFSEHHQDGIVLDQFMGSGTTAVVARKLNRNYVGFEINGEYVKIAERKLKREVGMFA